MFMDGPHAAVHGISNNLFGVARQQMSEHFADARWNGTLQGGKGSIESQSGAVKSSYDWKARIGEAAGTNPEELIAAAHAGCFSMALAGALGKAGFPPTSIHTKANVTFGKEGDGFAITKIALTCDASNPCELASAWLQTMSKPFSPLS